MRQRIYKSGQREAFSRDAIYILLVGLGEVKRRGCVPGVRVRAYPRTRSQAVPEIPLNPPSPGGRCGVRASLATAARRGAAARRVRRASPDLQRLLTARPARPLLTAPPQVSLPRSLSPTLSQKPPAPSPRGQEPLGTLPPT